jgi:hypothetical protein
MKNLLFLAVLIFLVGALFSTEERIIEGLVIAEDNSPLAGANVKVKGTKICSVTDIDGKFKLLVPEAYNTLEVSYTGYETTETSIDNKIFLKVMLKESTLLSDEIIVQEIWSPTLKKDKAHALSPASCGLIKGKIAGVSISGAEKSSIRIRGASTKEESSSFNGISIRETRQAAGQITAGEWNDLDNWEDWKNLNENSEYLEMQSYWSLFPKQRYSVFVSNQYDFPVPNCNVSLLDKKGIPMWEAVTDHTGKAELWQNFNQEGSTAHSIQIRSKSKIYDLKKIHSIEKGVLHLKIKEECEEFKKLDLAFVVDATGSMADEITYLKAELLDVVERINERKPKLQINLGSVFYRDSSDAYLTQTLAFTNDEEILLEFINQQEADGGGDYPEAVEAGIESALNFKWNENAIARLMFLLLDAPPHYNSQVLHNLNMQIQEAAARGIKIIPITASGINRKTEFLMKFMAIATNGTYVFITDDSGIGNPHLDPLINDFDVEYLNDMILRLIDNYSKTSRCQSSQEIADPKLKIFPNPCYDFTNIELAEPAKSVRILSSSGKLIKEMGALEIGITKLRFEQLISGVYTLHFIFENKQESRQIILLNG